MNKRISTVFSLLFIFAFICGNNLKAQNSDPASLPVYQASGTITVDGNLTEPDWSSNIPALMFRINGTSNAPNIYTPTGYAIVKAPYTDTSTCYVRFLHNGMDLYVSLQSNDKSVCKFDWEGDGMFMVMQDGNKNNMEFHLYVKADTTFGFETGGGNPAPAGSVEGIGIVNGTIYDSTDVDNGYTAEMVIHLDKIGFTSMPDSLHLYMDIFDPDNIAYGQPWGPYGNYAKQWWGSEWGSSLRALTIVDAPLPVELTSLSAFSTGNKVELKWNTATEINNSGFAIERSADNVSYVKIGFVRGHGTSTQVNQYSFVDENPSGHVYYRLNQIDFDGTHKYSKVVEANITKPAVFSLDQNYPNPFNPSTTISYSIPEKSFVAIKVYDILGNLVTSLVNSQMEAGEHKVNFNASSLSSGIYFYQITAGKNIATKKLMLLK